MPEYVGPYNLVVPNGVLKNSSDVFTILDPDSGGAETFSVALSETGLAPATYWGTRTILEATTYQALTTMTIPQFMAYVNQVAAERGRTPVGSVTAFKSSVLINTGEDFWAWVASLGLKPIN